jgi:hypothetical protein
MGSGRRITGRRNDSAEATRVLPPMMSNPLARRPRGEHGLLLRLVDAADLRRESYRIKVDGPRPPTSDDELRLAAERAQIAAAEAMAGPSRDQLRAGVDHLETALHIWRRLRRLPRERRRAIGSRGGAQAGVTSGQEDAMTDGGTGGGGPSMEAVIVSPEVDCADATERAVSATIEKSSARGDRVTCQRRLEPATLERRVRPPSSGSRSRNTRTPPRSTGEGCCRPC